MTPHGSHWKLGIVFSLIWLAALALSLSAKGPGPMQWLAFLLFTVGAPGLTSALCDGRSTGPPPQQEDKKRGREAAKEKTKKKPSKSKKK